MHSNPFQTQNSFFENFFRRPLNGTTEMLILENLPAFRFFLGIYHLREHKFKHDFQDTLNPLYICGNDVKSTEHFLLHCLQFVNERNILLSTLGNFNYRFLEIPVTF